MSTSSLALRHYLLDCDAIITLRDIKSNMSTSVSVGTDLKDYLSARTGDKPSLTSNIGQLLGANKAKQWFYRPLNTEESNDAISGDINGDIDDTSR